MNDHFLFTMSPEDFENKVVVPCCFRLLGMGTISFSKGPDGGRDALFEGIAMRYPSEQSPWRGKFVVQAKSTSDPSARCSDSEFTRLVEAEIRKIKTLREKGKCDNYLLFTNRKLSAGTNQTLTDLIRKSTSVSNVAIIGREGLNAYLSADPELLDRLQKSQPIQFLSLYQVPAPPGDFIGRERLVNDFLQAVEAGASRILGITGMAGSGKSSLAYELVDRLKAEFQDAQLRIDLSIDLTPLEAMGSVIHSINPDVEIKQTIGEARNQYLSALANRKAIVLLENPSSPAILEHLIPPNHVLMIVTSRDRLALPGMFVRNIEEFEPDDSRKLLLRIAPRLDISEANDIAQLCCHLPLALRLAGTLLAERPNISPKRYSDAIRERQSRFSEIDASIDISYSLMAEELQRSWLRLSVFAGTFDWEPVTQVLNLQQGECEDILGDLVRTSMVFWDEHTKQYRLHDLLRLFASQRIDPVESYHAHYNHAAYYLTILGRAAVTDMDESPEAWNLGLANQILAHIVYFSDNDNIHAGQAWTVRESTNVDVARLCCEYAIAGILMHSRRQEHWRRDEWLAAGLEAAEYLGDDLYRAAILREMTLVKLKEELYEDVFRLAQACLAASEKINHLRFQRDALAAIDAYYQSIADEENANRFLERMLDMSVECDDWELLYPNIPAYEVKVEPDVAKVYMTKLGETPNPMAIILAGVKTPLPLGKIAIMYTGVGRLDKALKSAQLGLKIAKQNEDARAIESFSVLVEKINDVDADGKPGQRSRFSP